MALTSEHATTKDYQREAPWEENAYIAPFSPKFVHIVNSHPDAGYPKVCCIFVESRGHVFTLEFYPLAARICRTVTTAVREYKVYLLIIGGLYFYFQIHG